MSFRCFTGVLVTLVIDLLLKRDDLLVSCLGRDAWRLDVPL